MMGINISQKNLKEGNKSYIVCVAAIEGIG